MCGRYAITLPPEAVRAYFRYVEQPNFPPRFNIAPTQPVPIVRIERERVHQKARHFRLVRWGFIPGWVKDPKVYPLIINARAEMLASKASFRPALMRRRCLFIADAFYEWLRIPGARGRNSSHPFLVRRFDRQLMGFAGLWEPWLGGDGGEIETACILTTEANAELASIHNRMPAILDPSDFEAWLDCENVDLDEALALVKPAPSGSLEAVEIGTAINNAVNDGPHVQEPQRRTGREVQGSLF